MTAKTAAPAEASVTLEVSLLGREYKVTCRESERTQSLHFDDRTVFHVADAMLERLLRARPIVVHAPFGRVGPPADRALDRSLDVINLLGVGEPARRRDQRLHLWDVRRIAPRPFPIIEVARRADWQGHRSEQRGGERPDGVRNDDRPLIGGIGGPRGLRQKREAAGQTSPSQ